VVFPVSKVFVEISRQKIKVKAYTYKNNTIGRLLKYSPEGTYD